MSAIPRIDHPVARALGTLALGALAAAPLAAQRRPAPAPAPPRIDAPASRVQVTPYAGVLLFGDYLDGPLGTSVRSRPAPVGGAQVTVPLGTSLAVVGNVGYSRGDLEVGLPVLGGLRVGNSSSWLYDAGLELRLPLGTSSVVPFVQAGGGAITTRLASGPVNTTSTNLAFNAAGGLDVGFGRNTALRVQVKDYVGRFTSQRVAGLEARGDVAHNVALSAGLRFAF